MAPQNLELAQQSVMAVLGSQAQGPITPGLTARCWGLRLVRWSHRSQNCCPTPDMALLPTPIGPATLGTSRGTRAFVQLTNLHRWSAPH